MGMEVKIIKLYIPSTTSSNSYKCSHTNLLYNSFQNGIQIHENESFKGMGMQAFHTCISDILNYREYVNDTTYPYIIFKILGIKYTHESASTTPTSAPST